MSRHKSRGTRRGRRSRKGRVGTRKQAGGIFGLFKQKSADPNTAVVPAAPPPPPPAAAAAAATGTEAESTSWWSKLTNPFKSKPIDPNAPPTEKKGLFGLWGGGSRRKSRKTRHRRRRHHRK